MDIRSLGNVASPGTTLTGVSHPTPPPMKTAAPVELPGAVQQASMIPNLGQLDSAVKNLNKSMQTLSPGLEFSIDDESSQTVVKVVDQQTKEVLRQIPTEEALEIAKALDRLQGLLIKQQA